MKLNAGKRVLMFFHWLFSLLICAAFTVYLVKPDFITGIYEKCLSMVGGTKNMQIIGGAFLAIYLILVVCQLCLIFSARTLPIPGMLFSLSGSVSITSRVSFPNS